MVINLNDNQVNPKYKELTKLNNFLKDLRDLSLTDGQLSMLDSWTSLINKVNDKLEKEEK